MTKRELIQDEEDRLRRQELGRRDRGRSATRAAARIAEGAASAVGSGIKRLFPSGGVRNPDDLITRGPNRSLFINSGKAISPVPGRQPVFDKSLLVGDPNPRSRPARRGRKGKPKTNTYNQQMLRMRKKLWG